MNSLDGILDSSRLSFEGDFETQVNNIFYHVRLSAHDVQQVRYLFRDVEKALQPLAPGLQVLPFGSIVAGLGIKTSDVDCFVELPSGARTSLNYVVHARNILRQNNRRFTNVFAITTAKVPIVKFLHIPTNYNCDVNFKSPAGVQNSELIGILLHMDSSNRALQMAILVKYWSKVHKFTGTNLLASYTLTLLVIFYLQLMNILPSILVMQRDVPPYMIDNWNMGFNKNLDANESNTDSLYDLLGGFFKCYSNLNFEENIISLYLGRLINKKSFSKLDDVPEVFELYKKNVGEYVCKPLKTDTDMCIQDPFEHAKNCSVAIYPKLAARIKAHFQFAAKAFSELPPDRFLEAILVKDPTKTIPHFQQRPKQSLRNKVMKPKPIPKRRGLQKTINLKACYEKIVGKKL